jgi:hypothetical protein
MLSAVRFTVTWLAAWCQIIIVAAMPLGALGAGLDPLGAATICHAGADSGQPPPSQPTHSNHECVLCAICQTHGGPIALLSPAPSLPGRHVVAVVRLDAVQPRAPPPAPTIAAQPRGPPSLT